MTMINRRGLAVGVALVGLCAAAFGWTSLARAGDKIVYFTWDGYELPDFNKSFLAAHPGQIDIPKFGDDDEAFTKVKAGFHPDIAHPCYDKVERWKEAGLIEPIDIKKLKYWDKVFPVFRNLPGLVEGDKTWTVPWDWGNTSITYRTDLLKNPEMSWHLLWDPQYKGKIAVIDAVHDTPMVAGLMAGVDPFNMDDAQIDATKKKLEEQRPLLKMYTTDMTSVEQALASGELVAAMTWNASAVSLKKQGVPVAFMNPKEGMLTWTDGLILFKNRQAPTDLAYEFINAYMTPGVGKFVIENYGYGSANMEAFNIVDKQRLVELGIDNPDKTLTNAIFIKEIRADLQDKYNKLFTDVKMAG